MGTLSRSLSPHSSLPSPRHFTPFAGGAQANQVTWLRPHPWEVAEAGFRPRCACLWSPGPPSPLLDAAFPLSPTLASLLGAVCPGAGGRSGGSRGRGRSRWSSHQAAESPRPQGPAAEQCPAPAQPHGKQGRGCAVGAQGAVVKQVWPGQRAEQGYLTRAIYCLGSRGLVKEANQLLLVVPT